MDIEWQDVQGILRRRGRVSGMQNLAEPRSCRRYNVSYDIFRAGTDYAESNSADRESSSLEENVGRKGL